MARKQNHHLLEGLEKEETSYWVLCISLWNNNGKKLEIWPKDQYSSLDRKYLGHEPLFWPLIKQKIWIVALLSLFNVNDLATVPTRVATFSQMWNHRFLKMKHELGVKKWVWETVFDIAGARISPVSGSNTTFLQKHYTSAYTHFTQVWTD